MRITRAELDRFCPRPKGGTRAETWDGYAHALENAGPMFRVAGVTESLELCHIMAQWAQETGGFTVLWESGAYSAQGIMNTFGKGRHSAAVTWDEANEIAALPNRGDERAFALFERVYGVGNPHKVAELGNDEPGDGYKYRGFGIQQITGKRDHIAYLGGDYSPMNSIRAALQEWAKKNCRAPALADNCTLVTRKINGGENGLAERKLYLKQAKVIWLDRDDDVPEVETAPPVDVVMAQSRKVQAVTLQDKAAIGVAVTATAPTALGIASTVSETLGPLQQISAMLKEAARDHVLIILLVVAVLVFLGGRLIKNYVREDIAEGRYRPRDTSDAEPNEAT